MAHTRQGDPTSYEVTLLFDADDASAAVMSAWMTRVVDKLRVLRIGSRGSRRPSVTVAVEAQDTVAALSRAVWLVPAPPGGAVDGAEIVSTTSDR